MKDNLDFEAEQLNIKPHLCQPDCKYYYETNNNSYYVDCNGIKRNNGIICRCSFTGNPIKEWTICDWYKCYKDWAKNKKTKEYIFAFIGASAVGKDTAINYLQNNYNIQPIVSCTTRPMREGEQQDIDYHFISKRTYNKRKKEEYFFDERKYVTFDVNTESGKNTWYYGMGKNELLKFGNKSCAVDLVGLDNLIDYCGRENLIIVHLTAPEIIREDRAIKRDPNGFNQAEWERRAESDNQIFTEENLKKYNIDFTINNTGSYSELYKDLVTLIVYLQLSSSKYADFCLFEN